ncbi:hypothetical protein [Streptomyces sp. NPDC001880]
MQYNSGRRVVSKAQRPQEDPQRLFTDACLRGLRAKLCDARSSLDRFPPKVAAMAQKVAGALEVPELATT